MTSIYRFHPASLQRCVTQSVISGVPTQSVGTIKRMTKAHNPYGDGKACERIITFMRDLK
jgi:UDP-N-acetylglucosamine 2-epimerase